MSKKCKNIQKAITTEGFDQISIEKTPLLPSEADCSPGNNFSIKSYQGSHGFAKIYHGWNF